LSDSPFIGGAHNNFLSFNKAVVSSFEARLFTNSTLIGNNQYLPVNELASISERSVHLRRGPQVYLYSKRLHPECFVLNP